MRKENIVGYRSEVAYTIRFADTDKGRQTFEIFLADARQNEDIKGVFEDERSESHPDGCLIIDRVKLAINFYADYVKWDMSFSDVKCHDSLLTLARDYVDDLADHDARENCMGFLFYRIGEELNDIDELWGGDYDYEWLGVSRSMVKDWD
jgi:hypothetical protein